MTRSSRVPALDALTSAIHVPANEFRQRPRAGLGQSFWAKATSEADSGAKNTL